MPNDIGTRHPGLAVGWEAHPWNEPLDRNVSRKRLLTARGQYQAAVLAPIAATPIQISVEVQAEAEDAIRAITRFDAEITAISERRTAVDEVTETELAPLASVLLRSESASSSEIEGITAGAKALALAAIHENSAPNALLVTANVTAMKKAVAMSNDISIDSILAAHEALLAGHAYADPGQLRTRQVWIGSTAISPHTASFVPPHHSRVRDYMDDLMSFVHRVDLPVLAQVAIAHAQFETIHPFNDGNGRAGRALVHVMLRDGGASTRTTVPVSAGLLSDTDAYYAALAAYCNGEANPIIEEVSRGALAAVGNGQQLAADLSALHGGWTDGLRAARTRWPGGSCRSFFDSRR